MRYGGMTAGLAAALAAMAAAASPALALDSHATVHGFDNSLVLSALEIPFLLLAVVYGFRTAGALRGGVFGRGMGAVAIGMLVMAVGHALMMADMALHMNILDTLFGSLLGSIAWIVALIASWGLLGYGFHSIYQTSRV